MNNQNGYLPQLDSVRAIAIGLVLIYHWFPETHPLNTLPNGPLGVTLFFVLSGFLITQILLQNKVQIEQDGHIWQAYKTFVIRRALRIFPIYYLTLSVILLLPHLKIFPPVVTDLYEHPAYYFGYLYNYWLQHTHHWADLLSPYWSLAVEEQFYIFYPLALFFTPRKYLPLLILGMIWIGIASRGLRFGVPGEEGVLTHTCLDTFGLGAWWALQHRTQQSTAVRHRLTWFGIGGGIVWGIMVFVVEPSSLVYALLFRFSMAAFALLLVVYASQGVGGWLGRFLSNPVLRFVGKISYGLYVYHMIVPSVLTPVLQRVLQRFGFFLNDSTFRLLSFVLLIGVAAVSWYWVEQPFNRLKKHFTYPPQ
jgi:peptidoglycan/LPS O-acetylase OafA/YrhL